MMKPHRVMDKPDRFSGNDLWSTYGLTPDYAERIESIRSLIPDGVSTLLDVGCGNGNVINAISESKNRIFIVGVDPSLQALRFVKTTAVLARLPNLPFRRNSMDMVLCLQVLEHLNDEEHLSSLDEIRRIARRHVIIGVPYEENLETKQVLCAACRNPSHADGHLRRYGDSDIDHLLEDFAVREKLLVGVLQKQSSQFGTWIRRNVAGMYYKTDFFHCPHCGSQRSLDRKFRVPAILRKTICFLDQLLTDRKPENPYWIITLYERTP